MTPIAIENYDHNYAAYTPEEDVVNSLGPISQEITITAVIGTWCGDSKLYAPQFHKVLDAIGFADHKMTLLEVDEDKKAITGSIDALNIKSVPTFIIYKEGKELGRIIEKPQKTLELDLLEIITDKP